LRSDRLKSNREGRRGFTLIELLVTVGIIALLMGILLPVISKVREHSNRVACSANLHSLGVSLFQYAGDFKDRLPQGNPPGMWYSFAGYNAVMIAFNDQYVRDPRVFHCPSTRQPMPYKIDNAIDPDASNTGLNSARNSYEFFCLWWPPELGCFLTKMRGEAPLAWDLDGADPNSTICNHGLMAGGNVLFADSHVEWKSPSEWDGPSWPTPATRFYP
jgi:prepilin-type N-terminal cleavage/methylation domain-containing protein/prepilin-type processing-associated H-X9-DG protein